MQPSRFWYLYFAPRSVTRNMYIIVDCHTSIENILLQYTDRAGRQSRPWFQRIVGKGCCSSAEKPKLARTATHLINTYKSPRTAASVEMEEALKAGQACEPCSEMQEAISYRRLAPKHQVLWSNDELVKRKSSVLCMKGNGRPSSGENK